ncbi:MAG TPA: hypothetical protein VFJ74_10605 [Gemmatimonadaceae bacterium]|nr:hypothetical protein [Gemmatimonadaceae bacterium]
MSAAGAPRVVAVHALDADSRAAVRALARACVPSAATLDVDDAAQARTLLRSRFVEALLVDVTASPTAATWEVVRLARDFRHAPFVAVTRLWRDDAPALARCVACGFAELLIVGVDDAAARAIVGPRIGSATFAGATDAARAALGLDAPLQRAAWDRVVARRGLRVGAGELSAALGVRRERLSRAFGRDGAPTLKRTIDLVRVVAAASLLRSPGVRVDDAARILGVPSASQLSALARRTVGISAAGLGRLADTELLARFSIAAR